MYIDVFLVCCRCTLMIDMSIFYIKKFSKILDFQKLCCLFSKNENQSLFWSFQGPCMTSQSVILFLNFTENGLLIFNLICYQLFLHSNFSLGVFATILKQMYWTVQRGRMILTKPCSLNLMLLRAQFFCGVSKIKAL